MRKDSDGSKRIPATADNDARGDERARRAVGRFAATLIFALRLPALGEDARDRPSCGRFGCAQRCFCAARCVRFDAHVSGAHFKPKHGRIYGIFATLNRSR